jgi:hypothetical protein
METTGRFELPLIMPNQAQKHVTHNEALTLIDGVCHLVIQSFGQTLPPVGALIDEAYVVGTSATGDWFGEDDKIALNTDAGWRFIAPRQGIMALNAATSNLVIYDQSIWRPLESAIEVSTAPIFGVNTSATTTNRFAVRSNAALLTALNAADGGDGGMQLKLNKEMASDTASLIYQTGFSGRAEVGLTGDDDLHIKVSPDGSTWTEALLINKTTGIVTLTNNSVSNAALANMSTARFKGRIAAGTGGPQDITGTQATTLLDTFTTTLKGLAPASGGGTVNFLRADGAWAAPAGGAGSSIENGPARFYAFTDCLAAVNTPDWAFTVSGTGAAHSVVDFPDQNSIGAIQSALGTLATNRTSISSPVFTVFKLGQGIAKWANRLQFSTLSDATNTWAVRSGFIDSVSAESTNGVFFRYTNGVNAGKFQAVTRSNNVETAIDTGVTVAIGTTYKTEVEVNATATSSVFKINGVAVATITTNIPSGNGREVGYGLFALRSVGIAAINSYFVDYLLADVMFTATR